MYYAVRKGHTTGIFNNWLETQKAISGFSGSEYKKFNTIEEAEAYLEDRDIWIEQVNEDNSKGYLVAFTDGSYDKDLNRYSYGVFLITPDGSNKSICGYGDNPEYIDSNNIIGEIFGVINALDWAISYGYEKIKIYHDYEGIPKWLSGEWNAKKKASKMFVNIYKTKFDGVIDVEFIKVPGHCNIIFNEKADELANTALVDKKRVAVQGDNWFSIPYFSPKDFDAFSQIIKENNEKITCITDKKSNKMIYKFSLNSDDVTVTLFTSGKHKLLVQGRNTYLFHIIVTTLVELFEDINVENILGSAYRISIKNDVIENVYNPIEIALPENYPEGIKRLIKQAIINLNYYTDCEDYTQYVFPALKALEGHIKYLLTLSGKTIGKTFNCFNIEKKGGSCKYVLTSKLPDSSKKSQIEVCYNYYKTQRDTLFHFGDIIGTVDNTRYISTKDEADEIIKKCIALITEEQ